MGEFFSELFGGILELVFRGKDKSKKDAIPDIEYRASFEIKYPRYERILWWLVLLFFIALILHGIFTTSVWDIKRILLYAMATVMGLGMVQFAVYHTAYRCSVDTACIKKSTLHRKQEISWDDVCYVTVVQKGGESDITLSLIGEGDTCLLALSATMVNAWYLIKMAKSKGIKIC